MAVEIRELAEFQNFGGVQLHRMIGYRYVQEQNRNELPGRKEGKGGRIDVTILMEIIPPVNPNVA
jgi:hypothetical protein